MRIKEFPISEVIGNYISVQRKGARHIAICPFHNDTKPSLHINDTMGIYKCFACDASGDHFSFVQEYKKVGYIDALKELASLFGLNFDDYSHKSRPISPKEQMMRKLLQTANKIFLRLAKNNSRIFNDFIQQRKLTPEIAKQFSIGLTTRENTVTNYLYSIKDPKKREEAIKSAVELALIKVSNRGPNKHYDTFRQRIIFPIWDQFDQIIGFGGRDYSGNTPAKYLNSSDSEIFKKSNHLYGLNFAKSNIRQHDKVLIVEGYMDVIALHRFGFNYTVGVMGTALGLKRIQTLKNLTNNIYLGLDSDQAGFNAMRRLNQELLNEGILAKYLHYTPHKDPDDFLKEQGNLELQSRINEAPLFLDVELDYLIKEVGIDTIDKKLSLLQSSFKLIAPLKQGVMASELAVGFAKKIGINASSEQIIHDYNTFLEQQHRPYAPQVSATRSFSNQEETTSKGSEISPPSQQFTLLRYEKRMIEELVANPEMLNSQKLGKILDLLDQSVVKQFVWELKEFLMEIDENQYGNLVMNFVSGDKYPLAIQEATSSGLFNYRPLELNEKVIDKLLSDMELLIKEEKLHLKKQALQKQRKEVQTTSEEEIIMQQIHSIDQQLQQLKSEYNKT